MKWNAIKQQSQYYWYLFKSIGLAFWHRKRTQRFFLYLINQLYWLGYGIFLLLLLCTLLFLLLLLIAGVLSDPDKLYECGC